MPSEKKNQCPTRLVESIKQEFNINLLKPYGVLYVTQMNSVYRAL